MPLLFLTPIVVIPAKTEFCAIGANKFLGAANFRFWWDNKSDAPFMMQLDALLCGFFLLRLKSKIVMLVMMPKLFSSWSPHNLTLVLAGFFDAPIVAKSFLELCQGWLLAAIFPRPCLHLILDSLQPRCVLDRKLNSIFACVRDFLDRWQPTLFLRQAGRGMGNLSDHRLWISRQNGCDRGHVGLRIVRITRAIAAEEKPRPLRCVARQLLLTGHRSWQVFDGDRQRLE